MKTKEDREEIVRNLVNTFNDRDKLHIAYKAKMKEIIKNALYEFIAYYHKNPDIDTPDIEEWINNFVEERFRPE